VQTSSFFCEVDTRAQVSATMRGVVAHCTNRNRVLFRLVGRFEPAAAGESRMLASIRLKCPGTRESILGAQSLVENAENAPTTRKTCRPPVLKIT
jgi:hypothetical protein